MIEIYPPAQIIMECENPNHIGDPRRNHGKGMWWLKDPEWQWWCPNCTKRRLRKILRKAIENARK